MFTRQEVLILSELSSGKLSYLDKVGIVSPQKIGSSQQPTCLYTWQQLIQLRIIFHLRKNTSLQHLRQAKEYFDELPQTQSLVDKIVIALDDKVYFLPNKLGEIENLFLKIYEKKKRQITIYLLLKVSVVVNEICDTAEREKVANFFDRTKDKIA